MTTPQRADTRSQKPVSLSDGDGATRIWIEKAYIQDQYYRENGPYSLGSGLISPRRSGSGSDIYATMRCVKEGDRVLHLVDKIAFVGHSEVAERVREIQRDWEKSYFVRLRGYKALAVPIRKDEIFAPEHRDRLLSIAQPGACIFFTRKLRLRQGAYLTSVPPALLELLADIHRLAGGQPSLFELLGISKRLSVNRDRAV